MRVQVAGVAAEAGLLDGATHRALYESLVKTEGFNPRTALEVALQTTLTPGDEANAKARALRAALRTARGNAARFGAVSRLLIPDVRALPVEPDNARMAMDFAGAALATGDVETARQWAELGPSADAFQIAWTHGLILLGDADAKEESYSQIAEMILAEARTPKQKEASTRLFILWQAVGIQVPPKVRAFLAEDAGAPNQKIRKPSASALLASMANFAISDNSESRLSVPVPL